MAAAIAANDLRVDRIDLVADRQQRPDEQAAISLDPHRHLCWILGMGGHQIMQLPHASQPVGDPPSRKHLAGLVEQAQVMVALAPVHHDKQHDVLLCSRPAVCEREGPAAP